MEKIYFAQLALQTGFSQDLHKTVPFGAFMQLYQYVYWIGLQKDTEAHSLLTMNNMQFAHTNLEWDFEKHTLKCFKSVAPTEWQWDCALQ